MNQDEKFLPLVFPRNPLVRMVTVELRALLKPTGVHVTRFRQCTLSQEA